MDFLPVDSSSILTASKYFGGKVGGSSTESASQFVSKNLVLAQTEVNHLDMTVSIQQKILQFEVPIYDPPFVQVPKCANYFGSIKPENLEFKIVLCLHIMTDLVLSSENLLSFLR